MSAVEELRAELREHAKQAWLILYKKHPCWKAADALEALENERDAALSEVEVQRELKKHARKCCDEAEARATALEKVLEPFAEFGEQNTDSEGWAGLRCERERINVWFGPSDFRRAFEARSLSPKPGDETPTTETKGNS